MKNLREEVLCVEGFHRQGHEDMIVYWNERSSDQGCSVKNISRWCGGQDSTLNNFGFSLDVVVRTIEEIVLPQ